MAKFEVFNTENCYICSEFMGSFKSDLTVVTGYSEKPIYQLIGKWKLMFWLAFLLKTNVYVHPQNPLQIRA